MKRNFIEIPSEIPETNYTGLKRSVVLIGKNLDILNKKYKKRVGIADDAALKLGINYISGRLGGRKKTAVQKALSPSKIRGGNVIMLSFHKEFYARTVKIIIVRLARLRKNKKREADDLLCQLYNIVKGLHETGVIKKIEGTYSDALIPLQKKALKAKLCEERGGIGVAVQAILSQIALHDRKIF